MRAAEKPGSVFSHKKKCPRLTDNQQMNHIPIMSQDREIGISLGSYPGISGSNPGPATITPEETEIVVASYNENLWFVDELKKMGYMVSVYNTHAYSPLAYSIDQGTGWPQNIRKVDCFKLPNISREGSQWAHHMVKRKFSPFNVFVQADFGWSIGDDRTENGGPSSQRFENFIEWLAKVPRMDFLCVYSEQNTIRTLDDGELNNIKKQIFTEERCLPLIAPVQTIGGQFMASKRLLERIPLSFYKRLEQRFEKNPRLAWEIEFLWPAVLDCYGLVFPYSESKTP
jgi:hypothetical protein